MIIFFATLYIKKHITETYVFIVPYIILDMEFNLRRFIPLKLMDILNWLEASPTVSLVILILTTLFGFFFKKVSEEQKNLKVKEEQRLITQIQQYSQLSISLNEYIQNNTDKNTFITERLIPLIPYIDHDIYKNIKKSVRDDDGSIQKLLQEIEDKLEKLKQRLDQFNPDYDRTTATGSILAFIHLTERLFAPIFITSLIMMFVLIFLFLYLSLLSGKITWFLTGASLIIPGSIALSYTGIILDKKFNFNIKNILIIALYYLICIALAISDIWYPGLLIIVISIIYTMIFHPNSFKKREGNK